jgi:hypothetical protein
MDVTIAVSLPNFRPQSIARILKILFLLACRKQFDLYKKKPEAFQPL